MESEVKVKSLFKALKILECFSIDMPELGITELSNMMGLYKSNVHNIIATFEKAGYVEKNPDNDKYRLGMKVLELASVVNSNISFKKILFPYMQEISDKVNEVVYLGIPKGEDVLYLDAAYPKGSTPTRSILGIRAPMYCTAIGKAMLAYLNKEEIIEKSRMVKYTENTIVDKFTLYKELLSIYENGYSIDNMEHEYGIKCVGAPVLNSRGNVVAGLSISGPSLRFSDEKIDGYQKLLKEYISAVRNKV